MKKVILVLIALTLVLSFYQLKDKTTFSKVTTNDDYDFISINNIKMWVSNNGNESHNPETQGYGFYWPKDSAVILPWSGREVVPNLIFEDGLVWGGKLINADTFTIRVGGSTFRQGLQAGKILVNGQADDPSLEKYRVYKIRRDWQNLQPNDDLTQDEIDQYQRDYEEWPVEDGAPWMDVNNDGAFTRGVDLPKHVGDETLWFVSNDLDASRTDFLYGSPPIGIERQTLIYAFINKNLQDVVFKEYTLINKSNFQIDSFFVSQWSDPDLGRPSYDFLGCDTLLEMSYIWNSEIDDIYGNRPPAFGYLFLNQQLTRFNPIREFDYPDPIFKNYFDGSLTYFAYFRGLIKYGSRYYPLINPTTGDTVLITYAGDPISQQGWYEGWDGYFYTGDLRMQMASGPFTFNPGDTLKVHIANCVARGVDNISSLLRLKKYAAQIKIAYANNFETFKIDSDIDFKAVSASDGINLYWDKLADTEIGSHRHEGYILKQYSDRTLQDSVIIALFDIENDYLSFYDYTEQNGLIGDIPLFKTDNSGLKNKYFAENDFFSGDAFYPGSEYYFGLSAFYYNPVTIPRIIETAPVRITLTHLSDPVDRFIKNKSQDFVEAKLISGKGMGRIGLQIIDPEIITDNDFQITFSDQDEKLAFSFINLKTNDSLFVEELISDKQKAYTDTFLIDLGFSVIVENTGLNKIKESGLESAVKSIEQITDAAGNALAEPLNVAGQSSNNGRWQIIALDAVYSRYNDFRIFREYNDIVQVVNWQGAAGEDFYEIRFTTIENGSEYYLTGYRPPSDPQTAAFNDDPKAAGKVPFQVWYLGPDYEDTRDDQRMIIKILDKTNGEFHITDSTWSQFPADDSLYANMWEAFYAYIPYDSVYPADGILPDQSGRLPSGDARAHHKLGHIVLDGDIPEPGTVIRIDTWSPLTPADTFVVTATAPVKDDFASAKKRLDEISVFPNPYFGADPFGRFPDKNFVRFTNLPTKVTIRIFSLSGQLVNKLEKNQESPWLDWNLRNFNGKAVASGVYIVYIKMPNIGEKVMKLAVIQDNQ